MSEVPFSSQALSVEVVGNLSELQQQEYTILGNGVLSALSLNPQNPEDVESVRVFLDDSIKRGLKLQQKTWFGNSEPIAKVFQAGFDERKRSVAAIKTTCIKEDFIDVMSAPEIDRATSLANSLTPFSSEIAQAEDTMNLYRTRVKEIKGANRFLFDESNVKERSAQLRREAMKSESRLSTWQIDKMLFRNLLLNFAIYDNPGIEVEPKDVVALSELWTDEQAREEGEDRVLQQMQKIARMGNLDEHTLTIYTQHLLKDFSRYVTKPKDGEGQSQKLELTSLQRDEIFLVTEEAYRLEAMELAKPVEKKEFAVGQNEIEAAHQKFNWGVELYKQAKQIMDAANDDVLPEDVFKPFEEHLGSLSPYEALQFLYDLKISDSANIPDHELDDAIPLTTYLNILILVVNLDAVIVKETGEPIFKSSDKRAIISIKKRCEDLVIDGLRKLRLQLGDALQVSEEFTLDIIDKLSIDKAMAEEFRNQPVDWWVNLLKKTGVEYTTPLDKETVNGMVIDEPKVADLINSMPTEKQKSIAESIRTIVSL